MHEEQRYMQRCLELAALGMGKVAPNPMVGCVVVRKGEIIGEGYHAYFGGPHAEVVALRNALHRATENEISEATLYVNLEPCSHFGKTPPCTELLLARSIKKVVIASLDPFEGRQGAGVAALRQSGVDVTTGCMEEESERLNRRFFTYHRKKRPYILLKYAQSSDGYIAPHPAAGGRFWISGEHSRKLVHKWRTEEMGIMVGSNTARVDNPQLTARNWPGRNPIRMVVDRKGDLPRHLYLFDGSTPTLIFSVAPGEDAHNTEFITLTVNNEFLPEVMKVLYRKNITSIMIEGGKGLLDAFISSRLWDEARIFSAPAPLSDGIPAPKIKGKVIEKRSVGEDSLTCIIPE